MKKAKFKTIYIACYPSYKKKNARKYIDIHSFIPKKLGRINQKLKIESKGKRRRQWEWVSRDEVQ